MDIIYKTDSASEKDINKHLNECDVDFVPRLSSRIDINDFSKKISEKAITFEAWYGQVFIGMVSAYFNDPGKKTGYINNVSVMKEYAGKSIASKLLNMCINYAKKHEFKEITLEVFKNNSHVIKLYKKSGFQFFKNNNDFTMMRYEIIHRKEK